LFFVQGIVLDVSPINFKKMDVTDCDSKTAGISFERPPVWLALDRIQDPMNFGAILRVAFFLGAERVIATAKNCCVLSPVVSKASSGAMEMMTVFSLANMPDFLSAAQTCGWEVVGTCSPEAMNKQTPVPVHDVTDYSLSQPTILVLGNEGYGVRQELSRACSSLLTIPPIRHLPPGFDSLNVGVAAGIVLHRLQTSFNTTRNSEHGDYNIDVQT
jgi:21S rRNA (GM2251-2'-O)-methyltransferase